MTGPPFRPDDGVRHARAVRCIDDAFCARKSALRSTSHCSDGAAAEALNVPFAQNKLRPVDGGENRMLVDEESGRAQ